MLALAIASPAAAAPPFEVPRAERGPEIAGDALRVVAVALPDGRLGRLGARRASGRRRAMARGRAALHRYVDDALARVAARPSVASAVHAAVDRAAQVTGARPLPDAASVVIVEVPLAALRAAAPDLTGVPWAL